MRDSSTPAGYFESLYARTDDPWNYSTSAYEAAKYAATCAALPQARFARAFEVGCSIGVLTSHLAARCDHLLAVDMSETALARARAALADVSHVGIARMCIPREWPPGHFDLMIFSEVLYYLSQADLVRTAARTLEGLADDGVVVLVHWLGETGAAQSGDQAATRFIAYTGRRLRVIRQQRTPRYRLDLLSR